MRRPTCFMIVTTVAAAIAACSFDGSAPPGNPDARRPIDSPPGTIDAPPGPGGHLLLTEVRTIGAQEFIEIYNPGPAVVALGDYYLTDMAEYWELPGVVAGNTSLVASSSDFLAQFPKGVSLGAGATAVVAMSGPGYEPIFGTPDYTVSLPTIGATPMSGTAVGIGTSVTLTNAGEMVALFRWDGAADLVEDVDLVLAGSGLDPINAPIPKAPIDGPDGDTATSAYAADALTIQDMESNTDDTGGVRQSYKRIAIEVGHETATGGNGLDGHDETTEQLRLTWDSDPDPSRYSLATPGTIDFDPLGP